MWEAYNVETLPPGVERWSDDPASENYYVLKRSSPDQKYLNKFDISPQGFVEVSDGFIVVFDGYSELSDFRSRG